LLLPPDSGSAHRGWGHIQIFRSAADFWSAQIRNMLPLENINLSLTKILCGHAAHAAARLVMNRPWILIGALMASSTKPS